MNEQNKTLLRMVAFAILMENGRGIIYKSPSYLKEKYNYVMMCNSIEELGGCMDSSNQEKLNEYLQRWENHL